MIGDLEAAMNREAEVIDPLCEFGRPIILELWAQDSCIASTRIGIDVLEYFGIAATPLAVKTRILNPVAAAWIDSGNDANDLPDDIGAWVVDIGWEPGDGLKPAGHAPGSWWGHVAIRTPHHLVDLSLDQATRPAKGIDIRPAGFEMHEVRPTFYRMGKCAIGYWPLPDDRRYRVTPDWTKYRATQRRIAGRIIRAIRRRRTDG